MCIDRVGKRLRNLREQNFPRTAFGEPRSCNISDYLDKFPERNTPQKRGRLLEICRNLMNISLASETGSF